jgi:sterol desaturase/sphingolipid hydroxylase (fatty acid hydroxylase superfamily)
MDEIGLYATIIISVLGVAYPILLQVIAKLDDSYTSVRIVELFEREPRRRWFRVQLPISLVTLFMWTLKLPPLPPFENWGFLVDHSGALLVMIMTVLLVISFILLVNRIFTYYVPSRLVSYLIRQHRERN